MARILLIEDNDQQRELYATLLYYNGFDVEQATTAEAAMQAISKQVPDLIMIDYMLPGMDGLYATKLLKEHPATAHVPVICFSAYEIPEAKIKNARVDAYMRKPLYGDALVRGIRGLIGWREVGGKAEEAKRRAVIIAGKESAAATSLAASLQLEGYRISRAADGASGIGTAATVHPDVVLVDLHTPVLDGWAVVKRLKQGSDTTDLVVFAFTDTPSAEEEQRALKAGFAAYLHNVDREYVAAVLERNVHRKAS